ncbi:hypothetical protein HHL08_06620 [Sphingobium sp. AR-3-1]|uniref:Uncharacterized protein n=1 Tax=Sphingobium psychrophilum TaxID=2728834 RepID=A0A7X9WTW1_9SPHN|nr:hypothetical protein [Sphingobium psychrophilum]NML09824.1 hypothetical protein [Sphingobium psychrophilum]
MQKFGWSALGAVAALWAIAPVAQAQVGPPPPSPQQLDDIESLFRIGVTLGVGGGATITDSYGLDIANDGQDFMNPQRLRERYGARYNDRLPVSGVIDFRGLPIYGFYDTNSAVFRIAIPALDAEGEVYQNRFNGVTRQASYDLFDSYLNDIDSAEAERLVRLLLKSLARYSPVDPLAGNPGSVQSGLVRSSLDLSSGDSAIEQDAANSGGTNTAGDPWIMGANYSGGSSNGGRYDFMRVDGRVARSFRLTEGGRALLKFDLPVSYSEVNGARAATAQFGVGVEFPVIARRWSLEPRVGYGITASDQLGSVGNMLSTTIASRYVLDGLGRGRLVIGNMVGYTTTLSTGITGYNVNPGLKNWAFRNGLAYDLPLKFRGLGRNTSARVSYTLTNYAGDKLYYDTFHEVTLSLGLRGREESARNARDLIRLNMNLIKAGSYTSWSAGLGFRF